MQRSGKRAAKSCGIKMEKTVKISLPAAAIDRIREIVGGDEIFEDQHDFLVHAVMDLLEEYR